MNGHGSRVSDVEGPDAQRQVDLQKGPFHVFRIFNDIVDTISDSKISLLCLLALSAAFDTVDHDILVRRLECSCGLKGTVLVWLEDYPLYPVGRVQSVN